MTKKTLLVEAIENGTVIDHIPAGQGFRIVALLELKQAQTAATLGLNLESQSLGKKDILKITGRFLTALEAEEIAVFAPLAKINIIRNYQIVEKFVATLPEKLAKILICPNRNCISRDKNVDSLFYITHFRADIRLRCHYCEQIFLRSEIEEYHTSC